MRTASAPYPSYRWITALTLAVVVVSSAVTIKDDAAAKLPPPTQSISANPASRPSAVVNDSLRGTQQASQAQMLEAYGKLPLSFEINQEQTDRRVKFLSRGSGYSLFLTGNEAVLTLCKGSPLSKTERGKRGQSLAISEDQLQRASLSTASATLRSRLLPDGRGNRTPITYSVVRMRLVGANPQAKVTGLEELPGRSNYFIGKDPREWRTNVPNYARVEYANVYPGVDLVYYGNQRQLEYDFVVQPGADPRRIRLAVQSQSAKSSSQSALRIDLNGDLVADVGDGEVRFHKPVVYQPGMGDGALSKDAGQGARSRHFVQAKYLLNGMRVTFEVANYDKTKPLVIDPALAYSSYLGGSGRDAGGAIAVDSLGNTYLTGATSSADFPTTPGSFQTVYAGRRDAFVSKLNAAGSALLYSTYLGGSNPDGGSAIVVDSSDNAYVVGSTFSPDFPTTPGAFQTKPGDIFVSKLNPTGSTLVYSTYLGRSGGEGNGIAIDTAGNAYVTGDTGINFPTTPGAFQTSYGGGASDAFVTKLNATGTALVYSTYLGGSDLEDASGWGRIAVDALGNAYVSGLTASSNFPTTAGAFQTTLGGGVYDAFVSKVNSAGSALLYSTYLGGAGFDGGLGIAVDAAGNAYMTGATSSSNFPSTPGSFQTTYGGNGDAFVTKLNAGGSALVYSTYLGGSDFDEGNGLVIDASGEASIAGMTQSSNLPTTADAFQTTFGGVQDAFVSKHNAAGSAVLYSTYLGGTFSDFGLGIADDTSGSTYVTGFTSSTDFPTTPGAFQTALAGSQNAFISKFSFGIPFSRFGGSLLIDPDVGVFYLSGGFKLGPGGSINPSTEPVTFSVGSYSVTLLPGSFVRYKTGYVYQKTVNHIFLCVFIKFTSTPGSFVLLANRRGGTLSTTTSPVPVILAIGDDSGTTQMNSKFD
jgi:hypothetical protein